MTQKQKLTLERLDEEARKRLGELKKAGAEASVQLKDNLGDLKKYTDTAARRLSDGGNLAAFTTASITPKRTMSRGPSTSTSAGTRSRASL